MKKSRSIIKYLLVFLAFILLVGCNTVKEKALDAREKLHEEISDALTMDGSGESPSNGASRPIKPDEIEEPDLSEVWELEGKQNPVFTEDGAIILTPAEQWQWGRAWYNTPISGSFTATFRIKIGGGNGADGLTFMFFKDRNSNPEEGEGLGFGDSAGYAIEFDTFDNWNEPSGQPHIALIENNVTNYKEFTDQIAFNDNQWHDVEVNVTADYVRVSIDDQEVISSSYEFDMSYDRVGFSASTGDSYDVHMIDSFEIITNY